ncbi:hypothetical protein PanWU01x14_006710 [Parasponia andersonii]|uniref:Uncharacterized protein n=1 Tax=Parasponia andersonii TaxID=3476 RepID=A0A2P5E3U9_PARAD|nr:hypothetical protein PanWU01x14_006710 [Parasponia andersonii]
MFELATVQITLLKGMLPQHFSHQGPNHLLNFSIQLNAQ